MKQFCKCDLCGKNVCENSNGWELHIIKPTNNKVFGSMEYDGDSFTLCDECYDVVCNFLRETIEKNGL